MSVDEREDHRVEGLVSLLEQRGGLTGFERAPARDVRDLGEESRTEEQECLRRLAEREGAALRLDAVLGAEGRGLLQVLLAPGPAYRVEVADEQVAHPHAPLAEPAQGGFVEPRVPVLRGQVRSDALQEL